LNIEKFKRIRAKYPNFIYHGYKIYFKGLDTILEFCYEIVGLDTFTHKLKFPFKIDNEVDNIVFHIGLAEAISYYKITLSTNFIIKCGSIDKIQQNWWKKLYYKGLGEFIYINQIYISQDDMFKFDIQATKKFKQNSYETNNISLIPIGGGKDSIVTYKLLQGKMENILVAINPIKASKDILETREDSIIIDRILDAKIIALNQTKKFFNGHIPFSSIVAFIMKFVAIHTKSRYIVLSNESSANEENVMFNNLAINHQYSKSLEFENDFRWYVSNFITKDIEYFSLLRPLHEIQIAMLFTKIAKDYYTIFRSCNVGSKQNIWCNSCPKCLFVYIMFAPFLDEAELINIFGEDLLDKQELYNIFIELVDKTQTKPLECVGSYDEVNFALMLTIKKYRDSNTTLPYLLQRYNELNIEIKNHNLLNDFNDNHNLPIQLATIISGSDTD